MFNLANKHIPKPNAVNICLSYETEIYFDYCAISCRKANQTTWVCVLLSRSGLDDSHVGLTD